MKEKPKIQSFISLKMVQRKVANIRLGIQDNTNTLKTEKKQAYTPKTSLLNNHDCNKSKRADSKAIKMKKSRSSDTGIGLRSPCNPQQPPRHPIKPPHLITPSPNKPSQCNPNYMKSTSSFEARKEKTAKVISSISSTSKLQKVAKIQTKSSSFKKATRTLKRVPSLKLKQNAKTAAATKTCSSTQKDAKFPPYLELKPGATEAKGKSVHRVCSYSYCSLNGDHHTSARTPLKRFMSLRRKLLKTEVFNGPEVLPPRKGELSECKGRGVEGHNEEFFVDIFVPNRGVDQQVSESLSDGPCSEIDLQDNQDQCEDTKLSDLDFSLKEGDYRPSSYVQSDLEVQSSFSASLDEFCSDNSDLVWEEGQIFTSNDMNENDEVCIQNDYSNDYDKPGFETGNSVDGCLDEFHKYSPYYHDEIVEYLCHSDAASLPDSESTQTGEKDVEGSDMLKEKVGMDYRSNDKDEVAKEDSTLEDEAYVYATKLEEASTDKQGEILSEIIEEITEAHNDDNGSYQHPVETDSSESDEDKYIIREIREEHSSGRPQLTDNLENSCAKEEICMANNDDGSDQSEEEDSSELKLELNENNVVEAKTSGMGESNDGESDSDHELLNSCNKLNKGKRCRKADEGVEEDKEFNPRGPNFLELEPDPEAEKVDLRHQEMDERRNADEWMLDHALRKTVSQLTPARKKKVALLVEAFETVLPVSKNESDVRRDSLDHDA